jgi:hypothetical protein
MKMWIGLTWLRIRTCSVYLRMRLRTTGFHIKRGNSLLAKELLASKQEPFCMLVSSLSRRGQPSHLSTLRSSDTCCAAFSDRQVSRCVLVFTEFCIVCIVFFVLFRLCLFILICFICTSLRTTATE